MRRQYTASDRERLLAEVRATGHPVKVVAGRLGVSVSTAYLWVQGSLKAPPVKFAEVVPARVARQSRMVVQVGAACIAVEPGFDADLLRAVVAALGSGT